MITKGLFTPNISSRVTINTSINVWKDFIELYLNQQWQYQQWRYHCIGAWKRVPNLFQSMNSIVNADARSKQGLNLVAWFREAIHRTWVESTAVWKGPLSTPYSRQVQCYLRALSLIEVLTSWTLFASVHCECFPSIKLKPEGRFWESPTRYII